MPGERTNLNQLMVLSGINEQKESYQEMARNLGLTLQGVLYHVKNLKNAGYLDENDKITPSGYNFLYNGLSDFASRISENLNQLNRELVWEAIAEDSIKKGQRVSIYMKDGYLRASSQLSGNAHGLSDRDAEGGSILGVTRIDGIIEIEFGLVEINVISSASNGALDKTREKLENKKHDVKIGTIGEFAYYLLSGYRIDFEYAALRSAYDAAIRGISSMIFVSESRFLFISSELSELSRKYPQVRISVNSI